MTNTSATLTINAGIHDFAFETTSFGRAKLVHRRLKVKDGVAAMPFQCIRAEGLSCQGKVSLSTTAKIGGRCAALLSVSHKRSIPATLNGVFGTQQGTLNQSLTRFG